MNVVSVKENDTFNSDDAFPSCELSEYLCRLSLRSDAIHQYEVEAFEYSNFKAMAGPVELQCFAHRVLAGLVLSIKL